MAINEELFAIKKLEADMKKYDDKRKALQEVRLEGALICSKKEKKEYEAKRKILEEEYDDALKKYEECKKEVEKRKRICQSHS